MPILRDTAHVLVKRTRVKVTPEAAIITAGGTVAYAGRLDDRFGKLGRQRPEATRHDLRAPLDAVLAGQAVANPRVEAIGRPIADLGR